MDFKDFQTAVTVGDWNHNFAIKSAWPSQGRIEGVGDIGGGNHDHLSASLQTVHQGQELRDYATFHLMLSTKLFTLGGDGVDFVDENDAWGLAGGFFKEFAEVTFGLSLELLHDLRATDRKELYVRLVGCCAGDQRFTTSWWAVK